jgi:hypothetical protein
MNWKRAVNLNYFVLTMASAASARFGFNLIGFFYRMNNKTQDIRIIQTSVSIICLSFASGNNADLGLNNSDILLSLIQ